ncbi:hypothetical protein SAMN05192574_102920 [Mucilaginibacter gossypiicola]|uniref:PAS fold-containing protein n=1 Tax=Mucilaginibacter gossypiicola TaxID=551995 RepID=A0A1H8F2T4_9SPHI|nr:hypothetical protein [Mucilaginibacter gossypiicola]SEN25407.1 hypothetical protein SAMN05192574_102920 [Mucilaginibacter gossypiicola]
MTVPIHLNTHILNYLSVGSIWQNILFYTSIFGLIYINIFLTRRKKTYKIQPALGLPGEKDGAMLPAADSNEPKTNADLNNEIEVLKNELLTLGEELELSYMKSDRLNDQLSEILDSLELTIEYDHTLWDWSLDFSSRVVTLSEYGLRLRGFPANAKPVFDEAVTVIDVRYRQAVIDAIEKSFKTGAEFSMTYVINPLDGSQPKEIKSAGRVQYNEHGAPIRLFGTFALTYTPPLVKK